MPKIEVNEKLFFNLLETTYDYDTLEKKLTFAKAELDEKPDTSEPESKRTIKIELNDTNRPDLWSTAGVARCLREHEGAPHKDYRGFLSTVQVAQDAGNRIVTVDSELKDIRPYMVAFVITGKPIDEPMLLDIIQTQEKLTWNFGRKRKTISMGVYRAANLKWPVRYKAVDPDATSFVPLQETRRMTCRQILTEHPKGRDYGWIIEECKKFPLLTDDTGEVMSMAPVINSATLGQIEVGDKELLVELTGSEMESLMLSANIVACDFFDAGYKILPVKVQHPYETGYGTDITIPFYFQQPTKARLSEINKKLGSTLDSAKVKTDLERMGNAVSLSEEMGDTVFTVTPAPYRNDFLHEVDVIEDVMIGQGLDFFEPQSPNDFTIGRLLPITMYSRKAKNIMAGMGYQEMIFNYLGSKKSYIDKMNVDGAKVIEIANPMSENYQFIRPSIIASLLEAESKSANAVYPHKIFEVGKIAFIEPSENTGTKTVQSLGFVTSAGNASFNTAASEVSTLLYYLDHNYQVQESHDPRFIPGRQAAVMVNGVQAGIFGEIHPQVLENWQITVPCVAGELDLEFLMSADSVSEKEIPADADIKKAPAQNQVQNSQMENSAQAQSPAGHAAKSDGPELAEDQIEHFNKYIDLRVAVIKSVEPNPQGEKLYIEHLDDGSGTERIIQSGLRDYLSPEELIGQHVVIAANLAPRKMRGVESHGMLLAADYTENGAEKVELITAPWAAPGTPVVPQGSDEAAAATKPQKIDIERFCKVEYRISGKQAQVGGVPLVAAGKPLTTQKADNCAIE